MYIRTGVQKTYGSPLEHDVPGKNHVLVHGIAVDEFSQAVRSHPFSNRRDRAEAVREHERRDKEGLRWEGREKGNRVTAHPPKIPTIVPHHSSTKDKREMLKEK